MATTRNSAPAAQALISATIVRGTFEDVVDGKTVSYGPGSTVSVCAEDLAMLKRLGFVRDDDAAAPEVVQDGTLVSLQTEPGQGPTITSAA